MSFESFLFNREANQTNKERNEEPPAKRQRAGEDPSETVAAATAKDPAKVVQQDDETAIFAAMAKIAAHIGTKGKFKKAGSLARQLLASGTLERKHGRAFIKVLETAMLDRPNVNDPALKNDYRALFLAAEANASDIFSKPDQQRISTWAIRAVLQNELTTDDNYEFNKKLAKIRGYVKDLSDWSEFCPPELPPLPQEPSPPASDASEEHDPFGLDALLPDKAQKAAQKDFEARMGAYMAAKMALVEARAEASAAALLDDRRDAIVACVEEAFAQYRKAWAQTSIDMLVKDVHSNLLKFSPPQRERIQSISDAVVKTQTTRRQAAQREKKRDITSFDQARAKYATMDISVRHAVTGGAGVDGRGESCALDINAMGRQ